MHTCAGNEFAGLRICFDPVRLDTGCFVAGSLEGELLAGTFLKPPGDDNPGRLAGWGGGVVCAALHASAVGQSAFAQHVPPHPMHAEI